MNLEQVFSIPLCLNSGLDIDTKFARSYYLFPILIATLHLFRHNCHRDL